MSWLVCGHSHHCRNAAAVEVHRYEPQLLGKWSDPPHTHILPQLQGAEEPIRVVKDTQIPHLWYLWRIFEHNSGSRRWVVGEGVRMCVWCPPMTPFFAFTITPLGLYDGTVTNRAKSSRNTRSGVATPAKAFAKRQSEKRSKRVCRGWQSGPAGPAGRPAGASSQPGYFIPEVFPTAAPPEHDLGGCSHSCVSGGKRSDMGEYGGGTGRCTDPRE